MADTAAQAPALKPAGDPSAEEGAKEVQARLAQALSGAFLCQSAYIGEKLGLYKALNKLDKCSSQQLAEETGLHERWVREWLYHQAANRMVCCNTEATLYWLSAGQADVLVHESGPAASDMYFIGAPVTAVGLLEQTDKLVQSFKTGIGMTFDDHGAACADSGCRLGAVWLRHHLISSIRSTPQLVETLEKGTRIADVGCGAGFSTLLLAEAFPNCQVDGYEISLLALDSAEKAKAAKGVGDRVRFLNAALPEQRLPETPTYGLVLIFMAVHDMTHPDRVLEAARKSAVPGGFLVVGDVRCHNTHADNIAKLPSAPMVYGFSISACLGSAMSEKDGMGMGSAGFPEVVAHRMIREAGYASVENLPWQSKLSQFYLATA